MYRVDHPVRVYFECFWLLRISVVVFVEFCDAEEEHEQRRWQREEKTERSLRNIDARFTTIKLTLRYPVLTPLRSWDTIPFYQMNFFLYSLPRNVSHNLLASSRYQEFWRLPNSIAEASRRPERTFSIGLIVCEEWPNVRNNLLSQQLSYQLKVSRLNFHVIVDVSQEMWRHLWRPEDWMLHFRTCLCFQFCCCPSLRSRRITINEFTMRASVVASSARLRSVSSGASFALKTIETRTDTIRRNPRKKKMSAELSFELAPVACDVLMRIQNKRIFRIDSMCSKISLNVFSMALPSPNSVKQVRTIFSEEADIKITAVGNRNGVNISFFPRCAKTPIVRINDKM